ncbi:MAG: CGGC domain-containing protein [Muricoprocola sp.]
MKKIGILTCARSNDVCARVSCLNAFNNRTDYFQNYGSDTVLSAVMTCNGCSKDTITSPRKTAGLSEKINRLCKEGITTIHVGVCRLHNGKECPRISEICEMLNERNITVIRGTHKE